MEGDEVFGAAADCFAGGGCFVVLQDAAGAAGEVVDFFGPPADGGDLGGFQEAGQHEVAVVLPAGKVDCGGESFHGETFASGHGGVVGQCM